MKETQMPPVHATNLVANSGNMAYWVERIATQHYTGLEWRNVNTFW